MTGADAQPLSPPPTSPPATGAEDIGWDIEDLVDGEGVAGVRARLVRATVLADELTAEAQELGLGY